MKSRNIVLLALSLVLPFVILTISSFMRGLPAHAQEPTIHYVAPGGDCSGMSPCYSTIQAAVDAAAPGDIIKLAAGTYTAPGLQVIYIDKGITLEGGYTTINWNTPDPNANQTILDAENVAGRRVIYIDGPDGAMITLSGLIVQQGYAANNHGGGIYILTGTVHLQNSELLNNHADNNGGGVYINDGSVTIDSTLIRSNTANNIGAGIQVSGGALTVSNSTIQANAEGGIGVHLSAVRLSNNLIQSNNGRGVYAGGFGAHLTLSDNIIQGNAGEGVFSHLGPSIILIGNTIQDNWGDGVGFDSHSAVLIDNIIHNNSGAGIYMWCYAEATLRSNTISGNRNNRGGAISISDSTLRSECAFSAGLIWLTRKSATFLDASDGLQARFGRLKVAH